MPFKTEGLGRPTAEHTTTISPSGAKAYAAATNDPVAAHVQGECAPPIYAVVPAWNPMIEAMANVTPEEYLFSLVHGEQDMRFYAPLTPGMTLHSVATPVGIHVKPSGTTVVAKVESRDDAGTLVCEQYMVTFFRGIADGEGAGEAAPNHVLADAVKAGEPVATVTQRIDDDQTFRYAEASGDHNPIHLDAEFATQVGLPGIINHGLCTMAFLSWATIEHLADGDPTRLRRFAVRFSKPVLPGQEITTRFWELARDGSTVTYGFETTNPAGDVVIKDGLAEVVAD